MTAEKSPARTSFPIASLKSDSKTTAETTDTTIVTSAGSP